MFHGNFLQMISDLVHPIRPNISIKDDNQMNKPR